MHMCHCCDISLHIGAFVCHVKVIAEGKVGMLAEITQCAVAVRQPFTRDVLFPNN